MHNFTLSDVLYHRRSRRFCVTAIPLPVAVAVRPIHPRTLEESYQSAAGGMALCYQGELLIYISWRSTNCLAITSGLSCSNAFFSQAQGDFALDNAMKINLHPSISTRLIIGYDIWCQYGVHLLERFRHFGHLDFPAFLEELTGIVGAWHIFAHVRECFGRNSGM